MIHSGCVELQRRGRKQFASMHIPGVNKKAKIDFTLIESLASCVEIRDVEIRDVSLCMKHLPKLS